MMARHIEEEEVRHLVEDEHAQFERELEQAQHGITEDDLLMEEEIYAHSVTVEMVQHIAGVSFKARGNDVYATAMTCRHEQVNERGVVG